MPFVCYFSILIFKMSQTEDAYEAYKCLVELSHPKFVPAGPYPPGAGLVGILWSMCANARPQSAEQPQAQEEKDFQLSRDQSVRTNVSASSRPPVRKGRRHSRRSSQSPLCWTGLRQLSEDPDQIDDPRLSLQSLAYGMASAIPFGTRSSAPRGILVVFARSTADPEKLNDPDNVEYLRQSAELIGSVLAWQVPHRRVEAERTQDLQHSKRVLQNAFSASVVVNRRREMAMKQDVEGDPDLSAAASRLRCFIDSIAGLLNKAQGVDGAFLPLPMIMSQASLTFFGSASTLLLLSSIAEYFTREHPDLPFPALPPFCALMTLQYGLAAAPASQPRNILYGSTVACALVLFASHFLRLQDILLPWLTVPLLTAASIATMAGLGITHPPAAAAAWIFADSAMKGDRGMGTVWKMYGLMILANILTIGTATLINNLSERRQYPIYWKFVPHSVVTSFQTFVENPWLTVQLCCLKLCCAERKKP